MKILAIGAHPDDIEFGAGGTLFKLARKNCRIDFLVMSKGGIGGRARERWLEQKSSARILKASLHYGGFQDTHINMNRKLIQTVERTIGKLKPDIIMTNYFNDTHQDHRNLAKAVETAARYMKNLIFFEVPTTMEFLPSLFVDIGDVMNEKVGLLKCHKSQIYKTRVADLSIIESARSTAIYRGYQDRIKYAEAFVPQRLSLDFLLSL